MQAQLKQFCRRAILIIALIPCGLIKHANDGALVWRGRVVRTCARARVLGMLIDVKPMTIYNVICSPGIYWPIGRLAVWWRASTIPMYQTVSRRVSYRSPNHVHVYTHTRVRTCTHIRMHLRRHTYHTIHAYSIYFILAHVRGIQNKFFRPC